MLDAKRRKAREGRGSHFTVMPYIMKHRYDAMNMIEVDIPLAPMQAYLNEKRKQGYRFSHLGLVLAAYLRTAAEYPLLNRFIVNKRIYRRTEFSIAMVVLKPGTMDETMSKMYFKMEDDIFAVHETIDRFIEDNRKKGDVNATDDIARARWSTYRVCSRSAPASSSFWTATACSPKSIIDASPFHTSMTISNLASIRTNQRLPSCI